MRAKRSPVCDPARILIADRYPISRDGFREALDTEPGFSVIGAPAEREEVVQVPYQLKPDMDTCGGSVPAKSHCTLSVKFKPTVKGSRTATMNVNDSANPNPQTVSLTGTGR